MATAPKKTMTVVENNQLPLVSQSLTSMLQTGPVGDEDIGGEDITIPRLKLGQSMSEEVKTKKVKEGDLFINVNGQVVWSEGQEPLLTLIVHQGKEFILWRPVEDGGGILARASRVGPPNARGDFRYKWDHPNQTFEVKVGGKIKVQWTTKTFCGFGKNRTAESLNPDEDALGLWGSEIPNDSNSFPAATEHHNFIMMFPTIRNLVAAVSMSRSQTKVAKNLNTMIKMGDRAYKLPTRKFFISTTTESTDDFQYKNWQIEGGDTYLYEANPDGSIKSIPQENTATIELALNYWNSLRSSDFKVDQSDAQRPDGASRKSAGGSNDEM